MKISSSRCNTKLENFPSSASHSILVHFQNTVYKKLIYIFKMLGIAGTRESGQDVREENGR